MSGNLELECKTPLSSRKPCHPSSISTTVYPTSRSPLDTSASAVSRSAVSSMLSRKWFQLLQPMGGVFARPLGGKSRSVGRDRLLKTRVLGRLRFRVLTSDAED